MAPHGRNNRPRRSAFTRTGTTRCRLLELPAELRNRIYHFALVPSSLIRIAEGSPGSEREFPRRTYPPLLSTCHQIRAEALAMFYGLNDFHSTSAASFAKWLKAMSSESFKMVEQIRGYSDSPSGWIAEAQAIANGRIEFEVTGGYETIQLSDGVFRVAFQDSEYPNMKMWIATGSSIVYASKDDVYTVASFRIESEQPLKLALL